MSLERDLYRKFISESAQLIKESKTIVVKDRKGSEIYSGDEKGFIKAAKEWASAVQPGEEEYIMAIKTVADAEEYFDAAGFRVIKESTQETEKVKQDKAFEDEDFYHYSWANKLKDKDKIKDLIKQIRLDIGIAKAQDNKEVIPELKQDLQKARALLASVKSEEQKAEATANPRSKYDIDFSNIGCGFEITPADRKTENGRKLAIELEGYSNNTSKNLSFISDISGDYGDSDEVYDQNRKLLEDKMAEIQPELLAAANKFDAEVASIMNAHGLNRINAQESAQKPIKAEAQREGNTVNFDTLGGNVQVYTDFSYKGDYSKSSVGFNSGSRGAVYFVGPEIEYDDNTYHKVEREFRDKILSFIEQTVSEYDQKVIEYMRSLGYELKG